MTTRFVSRLAQNSFLACTAASLAAFALAGCGMGTPATQGPVAVPVVHGTIMGGETPVASSTITMWETDPTNSGYGITAVPLGVPVIGSSPGGNFSFPTFVCTPGNFIYITSTGGDVSDGSGTPSYNPNLVMVAALGSCADVSAAQANLFVTVNELTTVAAAYALGNFMTVNAVGPGVQTVYIGAPAANNAATGTCTASGNTSAGTFTGMTCTAAGLAHAFANAANLVSASYLNGAPGNGLAYTTVPGNADGSVPQALINTLGNIVQYCTNSGNASSTDTTISAQCSALFADATPPDGTLPTDTLSALINIAHFPEYAGSTNNVGTTCTGTPAISGGLYCLTNGVGAAFVPQLSAAPHDWSLAIYYSGASNLATSSFGSPQFVTLDADDNVYVLTGNTYAATTTGLAAMTSNGTGLWANPLSANYCIAGTLATDTNGYVWETVDGSSSSACAFGINAFSTTSGSGPAYTFTAQSTSEICGNTTGTATSGTCPGFPANGYDSLHEIQSTVYGISFDASDNLWYDRKSSTCTNCLFELPYIAGSPSDPYGAPATMENSSNVVGSDPQDATEGGQILVDSNLDVFVGNQGTGSTAVYAGALVLPNTGTISFPSYVNQFISSTSSANGYSGVAANGYAAVSTVGEEGGGIGLDSYGNLWTATGTGTDGLYEYNVNLGASPTLTQNGPTITSSASHPYYSQVDGASVFWYPSLTSSGDIFSYMSTASPYYSATGRDGTAYQPCYLPNGAATCSTTIASGDPNSLQIDSTGSIWMADRVSSSVSSGFVAQIIGLAAPVWPQMSYGHFGVEPQ